MLFKSLVLVCLLPLTLGDLEGQKNEDTSRHGRLFSLFSVVTFPNTECTLKSTANDATPLGGLCRTSSECTSAGGTSDGSCAAGFGVCCKYKVSNCSSTVNANVTYIENPITIPQTCTYNIQPVQSDICQIRLDFVSFVLSVSTTTPTIGACGGTDDLLTITANTGVKYSPICGTNTGQHIYIENAASSSNTQLIFTAGTSTTTLSNKKWNIKVTQIECSNPSKAPGDCFQYFTGASGNIKSFNFIEGLTSGTGAMLQNQLYTACIRQEQGFCKIEYSTMDTPDNFQLGAETTMAAQDDSCTLAGVIIPTSDSGYSLFCGAYLSSIAGSTQSGVIRETVAPFTLGVVSANVDQMTGIGFNIAYNQVPCS